MWFDFTDAIWISDENFNEIISLVKDGKTIDQAFGTWCLGLDDYPYCIIDYLEDRIKEELRRRLDA